MTTMSDTGRWWQAYLAALTGYAAVDGEDRFGLDPEMVCSLARKVAARAIVDYATRAESSAAAAAALPEMCIGCVHSAKSAAEEPCASCASGSGRGEDRREVASVVHPEGDEA